MRSESPCHHRMISLRRMRLSSSGDVAALTGNVDALADSVSGAFSIGCRRIICRRGTFSSKTSSTVDKENVTVRARYVNFRSILKRVFGSSAVFDFVDAAVCSQSRGVIQHSAGEYISSSRYLPKDKRLPHRRSRGRSQKRGIGQRADTYYEPS